MTSFKWLFLKQNVVFLCVCVCWKVIAFGVLPIKFSSLCVVSDLCYFSTEQNKASFKNTGGTVQWYVSYLSWKDCERIVAWRYTDSSRGVVIWNSWRRRRQRRKLIPSQGLWVVRGESYHTSLKSQNILTFYPHPHHIFTSLLIHTVCRTSNSPRRTTSAASPYLPCPVVSWFKICPRRDGNWDQDLWYWAICLPHERQRGRRRAIEALD